MSEIETHSAHSFCFLSQSVHCRWLAYRLWTLQLISNRDFHGFPFMPRHVKICQGAIATKSDSVESWPLVFESSVQIFCWFSIVLSSLSETTYNNFESPCFSALFDTRRLVCQWFRSSKWLWTTTISRTLASRCLCGIGLIPSLVTVSLSTSQHISAHLSDSQQPDGFFRCTLSIRFDQLVAERITWQFALGVSCLNTAYTHIPLLTSVYFLKSFKI